MRDDSRQAVRVRRTESNTVRLRCAKTHTLHGFAFDTYARPILNFTSVTPEWKAEAGTGRAVGRQAGRQAGRDAGSNGCVNECTGMYDGVDELMNELVGTNLRTCIP
eukprot:GHVU01040576.1.p3 GENE.GHVU01040576.1~~GHVU01040576.1.p3  ORF type:complete len:107 (+),score=13.37 GHVU01040576.1:567-887(+)